MNGSDGMGYRVLLLLLVLAVIFTGCTKQVPAAPEGPVPELISPLEGDELDNGGTDCYEPVIWQFVWSEVEGAVRYQIIVQHRDAAFPFIDDVTNETTIDWQGEHAISSLTGWTWKVRAGSADEWWEWSQLRGFTVEESDQDGGGG